MASLSASSAWPFIKQEKALLAKTVAEGIDIRFTNCFMERIC
jgi:hypothetical protein